ncbi:hypothetical protein EJ07DRAFT_99250 [Lizonia empirigonia]|nr:hypothetical protein EJ07DRAFT_99250 [Lizonia empirigonia]
MYDPAAYNSLPALRDAASFVDDQVLATLCGPVRQLFLDHNAYKQYGIALLHKHFPIGEEERLVEIHHTSAPWKVGSERTDVVFHYKGTIEPRSFRYYQGMVTPYEFAYLKEALSPTGTFVNMALKLLESLHLDHIFGIRFLDNRDPNLSVEITEGKVNIMLEPDEIAEAELIEALWVFGKDDNDRCHCREHCWPVKDGHDKDHSCG